MFGLLPLWLVLFTMLVGWGLLVIWLLRRAGGSAFGGSLSIFQTLWLGYAGLIAFLLICSLLLPMNVPVFVIACAPAIAGFALQRRAVARRLHELRLRPRISIVLACVLLVVSLATAWAACDPIVWYDTGLYHINAVKWNAAYPAVPGLANLHGRLGFNNTGHLYAAFVDALWEGVAIHIVSGFLLATVLGQWFIEIFTARTPRERLRQVFCLLTLPFLLGKLWTVEVASLSSDLGLALVCLVLVLELLSLQPSTRHRSMLPLALIVALGATATTTKLGGLGLFAATAILALWLVRRQSWRVRLIVFALPTVMLLAWVTRNAILTGWLVFPVFGKLGVPWAVRSKVGNELLSWIESWARMPGLPREQVLGHGFRHWFVPWFEQFRAQRELILFVGSLALLAWRTASGPAVSAARRAGEWGAFAACALGLAQWFIGAPDIRFGGFLFWALPAALFAPALAGSMRFPAMRSVVLAMSLVLCAWNGGLTPRVGVPPRLFQRPRDPAVAKTNTVHTSPDTDVLVPAVGDQCWDAPLVCTPDPRRQVFIEPGNPGAGFYPGPRL